MRSFSRVRAAAPLTTPPTIRSVPSSPPVTMWSASLPDGELLGGVSVQEPAQVAREGVSVVAHFLDPIPAPRDADDLDRRLTPREALLVARRERGTGRVVRGDDDHGQRDGRTGFRGGERRAVDRAVDDADVEPVVPEGHGCEPVVGQELPERRCSRWPPADRGDVPGQLLLGEPALA